MAASDESNSDEKLQSMQSFIQGLSDKKFEELILQIE